MKKIVSSPTSIQKLTRDKKVVLVGGCFDLIHYGHLVFLSGAKKKGDFLVVMLESDEFIKNKKGRLPFHTQQQRAEMLSAFSFVDIVINMPYLRTNDEYEEFVKKIKPNIIAITKGDPMKKQKSLQTEKMGAKLVTVTNLLAPFSSTHLLNYATFSSN